ncbi:MAG: glycosyltransferase [Thermanaerothrix sp.]|nr:glycosyltransferase [Thermanaerothrix sp.]
MDSFVALLFFFAVDYFAALASLVFSAWFWGAVLPRVFPTILPFGLHWRVCFGMSFVYIFFLAASGINVELLGYQPFEVLRDYMQLAKAFIFAAEEDFGIIPVEAQACGTPVIAYGRGGVTETVLDVDSNERPTGVLFATQTTDAIVRAVRRFERLSGCIVPIYCRNNAERFATHVFRQNFYTYVDSLLKRHFS